jgi:hypothetical protein
MSYFDTRFRLLTNILRSATRVEQSGRLFNLSCEVVPVEKT